MARDGWVLALYQAADPDRGFTQSLARTAFLVSPTGERFKVVDVEEVGWIHLEHWRPGASRARATFGGYAEGWASSAGTGWLDLTSGRLEADKGAPEGSLQGLSARGEEVWFSSSGRVTLVGDSRRTVRTPKWLGSYGLDPSRTQLLLSDLGVVEVVDLESEEVTSVVVPESCRAAAWYDEVSVLLRCKREQIRAWVDGSGRYKELGNAVGRRDIFGGVNVRDGVVALSVSVPDDLHSESCSGQVVLWRNGELTRVPSFGPGEYPGAVSSVRAFGGRLYLGAEQWCTFGEEEPLEELAIYDPAAGSLQVLFPVVGEPNETKRQSIGAVTSWTIARSG